MKDLKIKIKNIKKGNKKDLQDVLYAYLRKEINDDDVKETKKELNDRMKGGTISISTTKLIK